MPSEVSQSKTSYYKLQERIAERFNKAAQTYDSNALLQAKIAGYLLQLTQHYACTKSLDYILDLGSATGKNANKIALMCPNAQVVGCDIATKMLLFAKENCNLSPINNTNSPHWIAANIEKLPVKNSHFDLVLSNLSMQWCNSLDYVFNEAYHALKENGLFIFSSLLADSLHELKWSWSQIDNRVHINTFKSITHYEMAIENAKFNRLFLTSHNETIYYPTLERMLKNLKATGVNTLLPEKQHFTGLTTRNCLNNLKQQIETFRDDNGLPLTYRVVSGVLLKEN